MWEYYCNKHNFVTTLPSFEKNYVPSIVFYNNTIVANWTTNPTYIIWDVLYVYSTHQLDKTSQTQLNQTFWIGFLWVGLGSKFFILFLFCFVLLLNFFFEAWVGFKLTQFSSLVNQPNPHAINNLRNVCILNLLDWFILDFEDLFKFVSLIYFGILRFNFDKVGSIEY